MLIVLSVRSNAHKIQLFWVTQLIPETKNYLFFERNILPTFYISILFAKVHILRRFWATQNWSTPVIPCSSDSKLKEILQMHPQRKRELLSLAATSGTEEFPEEASGPRWEQSSLGGWSLTFIQEWQAAFPITTWYKVCPLLGAVMFTFRETSTTKW